MRIAATGFVDTGSGSVASANAVLLEGLLTHGHEVEFHCKPSFVDPRRSIAEDKQMRLQVVDCTNRFFDNARRRFSPSGRGVWSHAWGQLDSGSYHRCLAGSLSDRSTAQVDLWLGDWARARGRKPVVSFVQGPPGTDARSVARHSELIQRLCGRARYLQLRLFAAWRLSLGLPRFRYSDQLILGSQWSRDYMLEHYRMPEQKMHVLPYPVDLQRFQPYRRERSPSGRLRLLWLGRFIPRKRLDLFLAGLELAIRQGCDVEAWVVGSSGFVPGYERLLAAFPFGNRLKHMPSVQRSEVPELFAQTDVMVQPSDEENFGSSVAEGLACGVPAIVGATNGTSDYICERSIRLADNEIETLTKAIIAMADRRQRGELANTEPSRRIAEKNFCPVGIVMRLEAILSDAISHPPAQACH